MVHFGLFGVGAIGSVHAKNILANPRTTLTSVYDPDETRAKAIADLCGAHLATGVDDLLSQSLEAVLIASATTAHTEQITRSAEAGKAVLCEKPIHNDLKNAWPAVRTTLKVNVPTAMGFNRRYAREHVLLKESVKKGQLGQLKVLQVIARTPGTPNINHLQGSRGIYYASTIHFFDLACWITEERPIEVFTYGTAFLPSVAAVNEADTVMVLMKLASGAIVSINNSYGTYYGYDERIEVVGAKAMAQSGFKQSHEFRILNEDGRHSSPLVEGWYQHMEQTYMDELDAFVDMLEGKPQTNATLIDGLRAQIIAEATRVSQKERRPVSLDWSELDELEHNT